MNYLAHIYLSGENDALKIGNFIADSIKGKELYSFSKEVQNGIILHRKIDRFTDTHPIVYKSKERLFDKYRHYSAVIVDILYDHFLAANWRDYCQTPLTKYASNFYSLLEKNKDSLPQRVIQFMPYMIANNWLVSYAKISGIEKILKQMDRRTNFRSKMHLAVTDLKVGYSEFEVEFRTFFQDLTFFCTQQINNLGASN